MEEDKKTAAGEDRVNELQKLNKVKALEVADLKETVDRLETEKSDLLEQFEEIKEQNEELKRVNDDVDSFRSDASMLEETRISLEEANERRRKLSIDLVASREELVVLQAKSESNACEIQRLTDELNTVVMARDSLVKDSEQGQSEIEKRLID